jgi:YD repeat-containing protein
VKPLRDSGKGKAGLMTKRGTFSKRGCFLGLALLLVGLTGAVPVFAASTEPPIPPAEESIQSLPPGAEPVPGIQLPTDQQMAETLDGIDEKEADEQKALETPAAVKEREASRLAYGGISPAEAEALLTAKFPQVLAALNSDPARYLSDAELDRPLGETAAEVTSEGKTSVMEGPVPVQAENDEGEVSKVDLTLEKTSETWTAANPLVEVAIGSAVEEGVEVGGEGLVISQDGAEESTARLFGDKNLYFSEVEGEGSDIDMLVAPTAAGAEIFDMLRSADSPQAVRFHVELPEGAQLRPAVGGGAEIAAADGSTTAEVPAPRAVDAQGRVLPVSLEVEGDTLVLGVQHREAEVDYPILLDPEVVDNWAWSWWNNEKTGVLTPSVWFTQHSAELPSWLHAGTTESMWPGHQGLALASDPATMPPERWLQYGFTVPNSTVYFEKATVLPFKRSNRSCSPSSYPQPHDYEGMWYQGHWNESAENLPQFNQAETGEAHLAWGQTLFIGIGSGASTYSNPCYRDLLAGGVEIWLNDWNYPNISEVSGVPTGWLKQSTSEPTVNVSASDEGLGVKEARVFGIGSGEWVTQVGCQGTFESPCPASTTKPVTFKTEGFPYDGEQKFSIQAKDPTGKAYTVERTLKLDGGAPAISLQGEFAEATGETGSKEQPQGTADELTQPVYNLKITTEDGTTAEPRSGVKEIKVYVEGKLLGHETASCSSSSCPQKLEWTYPVPLTGLTEGKHTLEIAATDFVGNEAEAKNRKIEFTYIPATGMKEDYVLQHFVLPDGNSYEGEPDYEGPELAVNVTNGNVVFHQRDVEVHGPDGHSLELERIYNSQQPPNRDGQWGHGWSLAQTPEFKPESGSAPKTAQMVRTSAITSAVQLPETESQTTFSSRLHATIGKTSGGGYEVRSATEEETSLFNSSGRIEETKLSSVSPEATAEPEPVFPVFAESLGSEGTGNGQFNHPADAVVDSSGNVWVVDKANNRLEEFNEAGEFVRAAGSSGSGAGQLSSPSGIARDTFGNLDVTDTANNRVVRFNEKGEFISAIGTNVNKTKVETSGSTSLEKGICAAASGNVCQAGTSGILPGRISEPIGITTNGLSSFLVVEKAQNRVEKFASNGELVAAFGSMGSEAGQLKEPTAIASSPAGTGSYWVADTGNNRVEQWSLTFSFIRQVGKEGSGNAEFKHPAAIEADSEGNVYVGDVGNDRVLELSKSGDYVTQFCGEGELSLSSPMGIVLDSAGDLWVTDSERNQVQEWLTGSFLFSGSRLGSFGTGSGQFSHPADVAPDGKGNLWVLDRGNSRLEKFNEKGEYLTAAGSQGTGGGKLSSPAGLAIDPSGNLWVADTANNRVEEFNEKGEFVLTFGREVNKTKVEAGGAYAEKFLCTAASGNVCQAGVVGSSEGQMNAPQGIAATSGGNLWVADTGNNRLKKFGPTGSLINTISSEGSEAGKVKEPAAIAIAPDGSVWVADTGNNRVEQWNSSLVFVKAVGKEGTGNGQFKRPAALDVDSSGNVWVGDQTNQRMQEFTGAGAYVAQLGGSGQFAFSSPMGLATDSKGNVWVTDTDHNRVQKFPAAQFTEPVVAQVPAIDYTYSSGALTKMELKEPGASTNSALNVSLSSGLATSVSSGTAGTTTYSYESGRPTAKKNAEGETKFTYDSNERITKVELPNGTWAQVEYDSFGRATKVTLKPAGKAEKTTHFWYGIEPRETRVWGDEHPEVIYSINKEGSVFKWEYAEAPPTIESISGSLWENRSKEVPNKDQTLSVAASSAHEIASIKVIQNGRAVIGEETCEDNSEPPAHNCDKVNLVWVTNPSEHAPGQLSLEVVATDFQGNSSAQSFWVTIPQQPPADPEAPEPPDFASTKLFREDYGLDRNKTLSAPELNKLVLELLYEWEAQQPVAVQAVNEWGVPMRASELAEMNYRREYTDQAAEAIPAWAEEHASSTYGGFYVDDRAGGKIYVGFTENQQALVEALKGSGGLMNPSQVFAYPTPPTRSVASMEGLQAEVRNALATNYSIEQATVSIALSESSKKVEVGATNPTLVSEFLKADFGASAPIEVFRDSPAPSFASRYGSDGSIVAGAGLWQWAGSTVKECTAGFGARAPATDSPGPPYLYFTLTAGHCYGNETTVSRQAIHELLEGPIIGTVRRRAFSPSATIGDVRVDGEGIRLLDESWRSHSVLNGHPLEPQSIEGVERPRINHQVCWSGITGGQHCGKILKLLEKDIDGRFVWLFKVEGPAAQGDSGAPVWDPETHRGVGSITSGMPAPGRPCHDLPNDAEWCPRMLFTSLLPRPKQTTPAGIVPTLGVEVLKEE